MQFSINPMVILFYTLVIGSVIIVLYAVLKVTRTGSSRSSEREGSRSRDVSDYRVMQGSYGYDSSYTPGNRSSMAGPLPVGGRQERPPTRSFGSYTKDRKSRTEED
jgi:hypothetical protein